MSCFSTANTVYMDACLGVTLSGWAAVNGFFTPFFASAPAAAIAYPLHIVGDARSAAAEFVDTPAFFDLEIRALSSVTFDGNRKIIRWVDYWDGRSSLKQNIITSAPSLPTSGTCGSEGRRLARCFIGRWLNDQLLSGQFADLLNKDQCGRLQQPPAAPGPTAGIPLRFFSTNFSRP
jgi:hypothetical protein